MKTSKQGKMKPGWTRREFVAAAAVAGAGLALNTSHAWAAPLAGEKIGIKVRQDLISDGFMDYMLQGFNAANKDIMASSSYVDSDAGGWSNEQEHALEVPEWYTEGDQCQLFLARGTAMAQLAAAGIVMPLDDLLSQSPELSRDDFHRSQYNSVLDSVTYGGKLWGIPIIADTYSMFCNMDLFAAGGVDRIPVTWEETIETASRLTRDTDGDGAPDVFGYSQCSFQFPLQMLGSGAGLVDMENKRSTLDTDEALEALDTYRRASASSPNHIMFEDGDIALKIDVVSNAFGMYGHLNYTSTALPTGKLHINTYGDSDGVVAFAISADADPDQVRAAWRLIEYMMSEKAFYKLNQMARMLPVRNSIRNSDRYQKFLTNTPRIQPFIDELEYAVAYPCIPEYRFIAVVMREVLWPVQYARKDGRTITLDEMREELLRQSDRVNQVLASATW